MGTTGRFDSIGTLRKTVTFSRRSLFWGKISGPGNRYSCYSVIFRYNLTAYHFPGTVAMRPFRLPNRTRGPGQ